MPKNQLLNKISNGRFSVLELEIFHPETSRSTKNSPPDFWIVLCFKEKTDKDEKTMQWIRPEELSDIRESAKRWKLEREQRDREAYRQMSIEYGVKIECYGDILAEIDRQDEIFRTCKLCGFISSTTDRTLAHRNSEKCRKRIAEKKGIPYVPKCQLPKFCKACNTTVQACSWTRHLTSVKHLKNISGKEDVYYCTTCHKDFTHKSRPKRSYERHLKNKTHLKKVNGVVMIV